MPGTGLDTLCDGRLGPFPGSVPCFFHDIGPVRQPSREVTIRFYWPSQPFDPDRHSQPGIATKTT